MSQNTEEFGTFFELRRVISGINRQFVLYCLGAYILLNLKGHYPISRKQVSALNDHKISFVGSR